MMSHAELRRAKSWPHEYDVKLDEQPLCYFVLERREVDGYYRGALFLAEKTVGFPTRRVDKKWHSEREDALAWRDEVTVRARLGVAGYPAHTTAAAGWRDD